MSAASKFALLALLLIVLGLVLLWLGASIPLLSPFTANGTLYIVLGIMVIILLFGAGLAANRGDEGS